MIKMLIRDESRRVVPNNGTTLRYPLPVGRIGCSILLGLLAIAAIPRHDAAAPAANYHLVKKVVLGGKGPWDNLTCDSIARRVYISQDTHVIVVDADSYAVVGDIPGTEGVKCIALAREIHRGFTSNNRANADTIFDLQTLRTLGTVPAGNAPDAIVYDPVSKRVFTFDAHGNNATVMDAATGASVGTVPLGGKPEAAVADGHGHIYDNLQDKSQVVEIDVHKLAVTARWPLAPCVRPFGLSMDIRHKRLFIGCTNRMMAVVDVRTGKVVATPPIDQWNDCTAFDPETQLAFSSNGQGTLTVVHEDSPKKFTVVATVPTLGGARTMALDLKTHKIFLVTDYPGSFTLLVFEP